MTVARLNDLTKKFAKINMFKIPDFDPVNDSNHAFILVEKLITEGHIISITNYNHETDGLAFIVKAAKEKRFHEMHHRSMNMAIVYTFLAIHDVNFIEYLEPIESGLALGIIN